MSMAQDVVLAGQNQSGFAGTDIIQLSDIETAKNRLSVPINGAKCLYLDNQSGAQLLVIIDYPGGTGNLDIILQPWDDASLVFDTEIDNLEIVNLTNGPVPIGFSPIARLPTLSGYVLISVVADPSVLQKAGISTAQSPAWYRSTGKVTLAANSTRFLIGGTNSVAIELDQVTVLDMWNLSTSDYATFAWWTGPLNVSTGTLPVVLPTGGTVDTGNPDIWLPPGGSLSMDVDTRNRGSFRLRATNPSLTNAVDVQALVRGM